MRSETYLKAVLNAGFEAADQQLHLPKNMEKGAFDQDFLRLAHNVTLEAVELYDECVAMKVDLDKVIAEAGDLINFCCAIAYFAKELKDVESRHSSSYDD